MKKRISIPSQTQKRIYQESSSACALCREDDIATLEIHHIDEDPSNNEDENLLLVCASCHSRITQGAISQADVDLHKKKARFGALGNLEHQTSPQVNISGGTMNGDIANTINNFTTNSSPKIQHPLGSIGANLQMNGYISYLIARYYKFKQADSSYGKESRKKFSHAVIHTNIQNKFGGKTFFLPEDKFSDLVIYLQQKIDSTIQGKRNKKIGRSSYHSYADHLKNKSHPFVANGLYGSMRESIIPVVLRFAPS